MSPTPTSLDSVELTMGGQMGPRKGRLAESFRPPLRPPTQQQAKGCFQETPSDLHIVCRAGEI